MFMKNKYRLKILKVCLAYADGLKKFFYLNLFLEIITMLLVFVTPLFYKIFIDDVIISGKLNYLYIVIIGYITVFLLECIISYSKLYSSNKLVNNITLGIKNKILDGYLKRDFNFYKSCNIADLKMRIDDDLTFISTFFDVQTINYLISLIKVLFSMILLFIIEWRLALFSIVSIPLTIYLDHIIATQEKKLKETERVNNEIRTSWLYASVSGWREVRALNLQRHEKRQYVKYLHTYALYFSKFINYWVLRVLILPRIKEEFFLNFSLYFLGGLLIIKGHLTIGTLLLFSQYYTILNESIKSVSTADADLLNNMYQSDRLLEELTSKQRNSSQGIIPTHNTHQIEFENVSFSYNLQEYIIKNVSLKINEGDRLGIIGESGCGKSTFLKLLTGIEKPSRGKIKFSNTDLNHIDENYLYDKIGFVTQDNMLLNISIEENLLLGNTHATENDLILACKKACIYNFIKTLPDGFNTIIGEKGVKLSGGQRQRLILARQFLRDVEVFIFDEATSALDQHSENIIQRAIANIDRHKTIIVVAHRASSIAICNKVIQLQEGTFVV